MLFPSLLFAAWGVGKLAAAAAKHAVASVTASSIQHLQRGACLLTFGVAALQPALVLIDHGHFQYNGIALGLSVCLLHSLLA